MSKLSVYIERKVGISEKAQSAFVNMLIMLIPPKLYAYAKIALEAAADMEAERAKK